MGYSLELGYPDEIREYESGYVDFDGFTAARVRPFEGGSTYAIDPAAIAIYRELGISPYEYGDDPLEYDEADLRKLPPVDERGLTRAEIAITYNYSGRIAAVADMHLANLHGLTGAESVPHLARLLAGLRNEAPSEDYWEASDGNIRKLAGTLLDWTFQHPDAYFRSIG